MCAPQISLYIWDKSLSFWFDETKTPGWHHGLPFQEWRCRSRGPSQNSVNERRHPFYKVSALFLSITKSRSPWFMSLYNWAEGGNELKFIGLSKCHKVLTVLVPVSHIATRRRRRKKVQRSISARLGQLLLLWLCSRIIFIFKRVNNIRNPHKVGWAGAVLEGVGSSPAWGLPDVNRRRWGHLTKLTK